MGTTEHTTDGADEGGWGSGVEDDSAAVLAMVARQVKLWREAAACGRRSWGI